MNKIYTSLLLLVCASTAFVANDNPPLVKKSILNAVDYGMIPGCEDAGICLNQLWADAKTNCVITLPPGAYDVCTPIVWTGKKFSCTAEQTVLCWKGGDQTVLTVGADPKHGDAGNSAQNSYIGGLQIGNLINNLGTGLRIQNTNKCVFERMVFSNFTVGVLQWVDQDQNGQLYYSYFNAIRDCSFYSCSTCIKEDGIPEDSIHGVQSSTMRIVGFDGSGNIETFFDFDVGGGGNYIQASSCQTKLNNPFIMKAGQGSNILSVLYFESSGKGANPWKGTIRLNSNNNVVYFSDVSKSLIINDSGRNNAVVDPTRGIASPSF